MGFHRGFVWLPILIVLGLIVAGAAVGGGLYWFEQQTTPSPTPVVQLATTTLQTPSASSAAPAEIATIDAATLSTTPGNPVITGTASSNIPYVQIAIIQITGSSTALDQPGVIYGAAVYQSGPIKIINGRWSVSVSTYIPSGNYRVDVYDPDGAPALVKGVLRISSPEATSVPGMSEYTDSSFGFSFWYPSGWTINQVGPIMQQFSGGTVVKELSIASSHGRSITIDEVAFPSSSLTTGDAGCTATYAFDTASNGWTQTISECDGATNTPTPYSPTGVTTMGGLITFASQAGLSTVFRIVPLSWSSAQKSLVITGENTGFYRGQEIPLVDTIAATDPSVATPVSAAQQQATIEAEQQAYENQ